VCGLNWAVKTEDLQNTVQKKGNVSTNVDSILYYKWYVSR